MDVFRTCRAYRSLDLYCVSFLLLTESVKYNNLLLGLIWKIKNLNKRSDKLVEYTAYSIEPNIFTDNKKHYYRE